MNTWDIDNVRRITLTELYEEQKHIGVAGSPIVQWVPSWSAWAIIGVYGALAPADKPAERFATLQDAHDCLAAGNILRYVVKGCA